MKKFKKFALLAVFGLFVAGAIGSAAFLFDDATKSIPAVPADTAVVLEFGSTAQLTNVDNLTPGAPQYREVIVKKPKQSTGFSETPTVVISYVDGKAGVSIEIAESTWNVTPAPAPVKTLTSGDTPQNLVPVFGENLQVSYYLKVSVSEAAYPGLVAAETDALGSIKVEYRAL